MNLLGGVGNSNSLPSFWEFIHSAESRHQSLNPIQIFEAVYWGGEGRGKGMEKTQMRTTKFSSYYHRV